MSGRNHDVLSQRVHILERGNRRWKYLTAAVAVAAALFAFGPGRGNSQQEPPRPQRPGEYTVDQTDISTFYANFVRVTGTPEELVLDFGLNTHTAPKPGAPGATPIKLSHRLVMSYYTAKRIQLALTSAVQQHEKTYGPIELDVQKRIRTKPKPEAAEEK